MSLTLKILGRQGALYTKTAILIALVINLLGCDQTNLDKDERCSPAAMSCPMQLSPAASAPRITWAIDANPLVAEQAMAFTIEIAGAQPEQVTATLHGIDMNMGTIPVFIDQINGQRVLGRIIVPACSREEMRWQADFLVTTRSQTFTASGQFQVSRHR